MNFDPTNPVIKLCGEGMMLEGEGKKEEAHEFFKQAWDMASTDFEKFTAAHYVARHQKSVEDKLKWDQCALSAAQKVEDEKIKEVFPSLYLNIAKCYEDLNDPVSALKNYEMANTFAHLLPDDGYGNMIKGGIANGIKRIKQ